MSIMDPPYMISVYKHGIRTFLLPVTAGIVNCQRILFTPESYSRMSCMADCI
jgi:hypothetical protein